MSSLPGRRVGLAILRIEAEEIVAGRVVIRVETIDEVMGDKRVQEAFFAGSEAALAHLGEWLRAWSGDGPSLP